MIYHITTYGCQMNIHDSEIIAGALQRRGYREAAEPTDADVVVFNTCCIRETAETRALGAISACKSTKAKNPAQILIIAGCIPQKQDSFQKLQNEYKFADIIIGAQQLSDFGRIFDDYITNRKRFANICETSALRKEESAFRTSGANAWINIMYGCDNYCSYCIVPCVRGRERSRPANDVIAEAEGCIAAGYKEITLLGQNVNSYRDGNTDFAALLAKIAALPGEFRLRFMTSHPKDLTDAVIDVIAESPKIADYIHLPAQSGSTKILAVMNRKYTREEYITLIQKIRAKIPRCGITSDFIAGFPGETEEDFENTLSLIREVRFNNIYSFIYSRRSGTKAASLTGQIPGGVKKERVKALIALQRKIGAEIAAECVGSTFRALIDGEYKDGLMAVTDCAKAIHLPQTDKKLNNTFQQIYIDKNISGRLIGRII